MYALVFVFAGLSTLAAAQNVQTLLVPFGDGPWLASVIASDAAATTYSLACAPTTGSPAAASSGINDGCILPYQPFAFTEGPATYAYSAAQAGLFTNILACSLGGSTTATCTETSSDESSGMFSTTNTLASTDFSGVFQAVTITDTLPAVTTESGATPTQSSGSGTTTTRLPTAQTTGGSTTANTPPSTSATSSVPTTSKTGGMPQITGNAAWAVGGMGMAVVLAGM